MESDFKDIFGYIARDIIPIYRAYRKKISTVGISYKADQTLLTEADLAIQKTIVDIILKHNPSSNILAEEESLRKIDNPPNALWIIDPIDGTREFINTDSVEFGTAICVVEKRMPIAAFVVFPEIGFGRSPVTMNAIAHNSEIQINGKPYISTKRKWKIPKRISATRSKGASPKNFEAKIVENGCDLKVSTTSQTIDLISVATEPAAWTDAGIKGFDLFYRENQKIWDGAPGILFNILSGNIALDGEGKNVLPFSHEILGARNPILPASIVGQENHVRWFLDIMHS